jgi:hypothetical protein
VESERWRALLEHSFDDPAGRVSGLEVEHIGGDTTYGLATVRFSVEDLRGEGYEARAQLFLPDILLAESRARAPVWFNCGYQLPDHVALSQLRLGRVVVTPSDPASGEVFPHPNPLCRGPNSDYVLAHLVRGLSFVDPAQVIYHGGSAGGYAALMVAAEAFPAAAVVSNVPVVNLAYQRANLAHNAPRIAADPPADHPLMGVLMGMFLPFTEQGWDRSFGADVSAPAYLDHSPVAHVERITCPAVACFSTADFLVPIEQVGSDVAVATLADLPDGVVMAASDLTSAPGASVRLLDVLGDRAEVRVVPVPDGAVCSGLADLDVTMSRPQAPLPVPASSVKPWLVVVVDEGPTVFGIGHTRHGFQPDFGAFVDHALAVGLTPEQLTPAKLDQLLDRWAGHEWLSAGFHHLDRPAAERADVERGLRTFCGTSAAHAARFVALYDALEPARRLLPEELVSELTCPSAE